MLQILRHSSTTVTRERTDAPVILGRWRAEETVAKVGQASA